MNAKQSAVVAAVRRGCTVDGAAKRAGVNVHTLRRWLSTGRKDPDGPYGRFAALVDRLKVTPNGPLGHARAFIVALAAFMSSGSDEDGEALRVVARRIPDSMRYQVMCDLGEHFLIGVLRRMTEGASADDIPLAIEEMFQEVDAVSRARKRAL